MIRGVFHSTAGMNYLRYKQEITSNNIANAVTTGFKKDRIFLKTLERLNAEAKMNATEQRNLDNVDEHFTDFTQGGYNVTNNPLDFALDGPGFFSVETANGVRYTRNGNLALDENKLLITSNGYPLLGENGQIQINGDEAWIDDNGYVYVDGAQLDRLVLVEFQNPQRLAKSGDGLYANPGNEPAIQGAPNTLVRQGVLEESNVNIIEEMVNLIAETQDFETGQKSISMQDATLDRAVNEVGRVTR